MCVGRRQGEGKAARSAPSSSARGLSWAAGCRVCGLRGIKAIGGEGPEAATHLITLQLLFKKMMGAGTTRAAAEELKRDLEGNAKHPSRSQHVR